MKMFSLHGPISYGIMGMTLAIVAYLGYNAANRQIYLSSPITDIFTADVIVPDFKVGEDPQVQYDRTISQTFTGGYRVEIKDSTTGLTICAGTGSNISYDKGETVPTDTSFSWYVNADCAKKLPVGQYYLETNYSISQEGLPTRYMTEKSNLFKVHPATDPSN